MALGHTYATRTVRKPQELLKNLILVVHIPIVRPCSYSCLMNLEVENHIFIILHQWLIDTTVQNMTFLGKEKLAPNK